MRGKKALPNLVIVAHVVSNNKDKYLKLSISKLFKLHRIKWLKGPMEEDYKEVGGTKITI